MTSETLTQKAHEYIAADNAGRQAMHDLYERGSILHAFDAIKAEADRLSQQAAPVADPPTPPLQIDEVRIQVITPDEAAAPPEPEHMPELLHQLKEHMSHWF